MENVGRSKMVDPLLGEEAVTPVDEAKRRAREEEELDETLDESFPASDPASSHHFD